MSTLYSDLADVYEAMYQTFIDYEDEFRTYAGMIGNAKSVLELGCGSGHLAGRFEQAGFHYTGLDMSADMLAIAREKHPTAGFLQADMRQFKLVEQVDAIIMTGRTISYLLSNRDVLNCFHSVRSNLNKGGVFCFDFIDASRFIPRIQEGEKVVHRAEHGGRHFFRDSFWEINPDHGWAFDWHSMYYENTSQGTVRIGEDRSTIRAFTKDEIALFLQLAGFGEMEWVDRESYAFETWVAKVG